MFSIVLLVGGKATRVASMLNGKTKHEINILKNEKVIDFQLRKLVNLKKKVFLISNKKNLTLKNYLKKKYNNKLDFEIIEESKPLGTAGALKVLKKYSFKFFLVIDGDLVFNCNLKKLILFHKKKKSNCTLVAHPNNHPYDSDILEVDKNDRVRSFYFKPHKKNKIIPNLCMSGIRIVNKKLLKFINHNKFQDFSKDFLKKLDLKKNRVFAYNTREYIKDAGTRERIIQVRKDIKILKFKNGNIDNKIPAIFLDRDGVINEQKDELHYQNPKKIFNGVFGAIKKINESGYLCILVTNQPAVAKGIITIAQLEKDLNYLAYKLGLNGAYLDKIYYCPHHPKKGFSDENVQYKKNCECRKPKNGMFIKAIKDLNIDVNRSYMIGDSNADYLAAKKTRLKYIMINKKKTSRLYATKKNLAEAVNFIFKKTNL